ncbi:MAG: CBS domain-containing protein [Nanoarchaeota archaeon]|nr:CBS domain-containing protein [Nanoarchaeota archaeon]
MARISKIMDSSVLTLKKEASISDAARLMANKPHGCVVIVEDKKSLGIITESDIVKSLISKQISSKEKVSKIMSSPITSMDPNTTLEKANKIIDTKHFKRYPVIENGNIVGLVTENAVVQALNDNIRFHRNIQNAVLILFVIFEFLIFVFNEHVFNFLNLL